MRELRRFATLAFAWALVPGAGWAYPGGTSDYQTDAAPFCASCHSSRDADALAGQASGQRRRQPSASTSR